MRTLFEISRSGLKVAERSLAVTSNNVINAETPGYSRQRVDTRPAGQDMSGYHAGLGVNMKGVQRIRNEITDLLLNEKRQDMGYLQEKSRIFEQLEAAMTSDSGGDLDLHIGRLFDAFSELSSDPQDMSIRDGIVSEAVQMTDKMNDMSSHLDRLSGLTMDSAGQSVERVNNLLRNLSELNKSIRQGEAQGNPDFTAMDLQVQKLEELSELVNVESQETDTGALELRIGGIQVLDENQRQVLHSEVDDVEKIYRIRLGNGKVIDPTGGKLGAELEMYEEEIPGLRERLDQLAETMVDEFNQLHENGYGLDDAVSRTFFDDTGVTAGTIRLNDDIRTNHRNIAVSSQPGEAGNGEVAMQIAELRNDPLVGGRKMVDYTIQLISSPGSQVSDLNNRVEARESEIQMLTTQQEREAGVNIDEELSLMIRYQNAYQGSAKVMSAAQQMYDTLISIV